MPRDLVLGNGRLLVCQDRHLFIRDLYWPHVGLYNHLSGRPVRFGVWVEGRFTWIDDAWDRDIRYRPDALVSACHLHNERLGLSLFVEDGVDTAADVFARRITATNHTDRPREVRLFLAADTTLCETDIGDCVYYDPFGDAVVHYKRHNYLLFGGEGTRGDGLADFACGMKGVPGKQGTWLDAEDGELSNNPIAQGSVDSAISIRIQVAPEGSATGAFWMVAGPDRKSVLDAAANLRQESVPAMLTRVERSQQTLVAEALDRAAVLDGLDALPPRVARLFRQSLLIIQTQCDHEGAILAANDSDIMGTNKAHYSYLWPRDGALVSHALDSAGYHAIPRAFFEFMARILPPERAAFKQKYCPDGSVGSSWHSFIAPNGTPEEPIQEDETALVVWALEYHLVRSGMAESERARDLYQRLGRPCAEFLLDFRDPATHLPLPSWDLWEERRGIHTFTVCAVIAALRAAGRLAAIVGDPESAQRFTDGAEQTRHALENRLWSAHDHRFVRRLEVHASGETAFDRTLDASLHALQLFDIFPIADPRVRETLRQVDERLWVRAGIGGMARYEGDYYARISHDLANVPGNPWILCTLWRARWQIACATSRDDLEEPEDLLRWADLCASPSGMLPEQIHPYNFSSLTVSPLTWSHSEYVETVCQWVAKWRELAASA